MASKFPRLRDAAESEGYDEFSLHLRHLGKRLTMLKIIVVEYLQAINWYTVQSTCTVIEIEVFCSNTLLDVFRR